MMKKNGFTLAEVLITLTIIGVVAAITLPALQTNTQEQQARTALKKMANTFSQAASMNAAVDGFDYSSLTAASHTDVSAKPGHLDDQGSLLRLIQERCSVDTARGFAVPTGVVKIANGADVAAYLRDGTAVYFNGANAIAAGTVGEVKNSTVAMDGVAVGIPVIFDINGAKGPNQISNCKGTQAGITAWAGDDAGVCGTPNNRVIRDQYLFSLGGPSGAPSGAASKWMIDNTKTTAPEDMEKFAMEETTQTGESGGDGESGGEGGEGGEGTP